jgi:hypothetical protein
MESPVIYNIPNIIQVLGISYLVDPYLSVVLCVIKRTYTELHRGSTELKEEIVIIVRFFSEVHLLKALYL